MIHHLKHTVFEDKGVTRRVLADLFPDTFASYAGFDLSLLYAECGECGRPLVWPLRATRMVLDKAGVDPTTLDYTHMLRTSGCGECTADPEDITITLVRLVTPEVKEALQEVGQERH